MSPRILALAAALAAHAPARDFDVNSFAEGTDFGPNCTFEDALATVNRGPGSTLNFGCGLADGVHDRILLDPGTYRASGLRIERDVAIVGAGLGRTTIVGYGAPSLAVEAHPNSPLAQILDITFRGDGSPATGAIWVNSSTEAAGGGWPWHATLSLFNCRVTGFTWSGVINDGGSVYLEKTTIDNNSNDFGGGLINIGFTDFGGYMFINQSVVRNNSATELDGGGIWNSGYVSLWHSTVSGNKAVGKGGGVFSRSKEYAGPGDPYLDLWHATVASNTAAQGGGVFHAAPVQAGAGNSIVANNTAPSRPDYSGPTGSNRYPGYPNLLRNTSGATELKAGEDITGRDPLLAGLGDNGGTTSTHPLKTGSPAVDAGGWHEDPQDQRYFLAPKDGNGDGVERHDLGAFEFDPFMQLEKFPVANSSSDPHSLVFPDGELENGWTRYSSNASGDQVTYVVPVAEAGTYAVKVRMVKNPDAGRYQMSIATSSSGTYSNLGTVKDAYGSGQSFSETTVGTKSFSSSGKKYFRFKVTGKNTASSGYRLYFDAIKLTRQ